MITNVLIDILGESNSPVYDAVDFDVTYYYKLDAYGWYTELVKENKFINDYDTNMPLQYFEKMIFKHLLTNFPIKENTCSFSLILSAPAPNKLELYNSFRFGLIVLPGKLVMRLKVIWFHFCVM